MKKLKKIQTKKIVKRNLAAAVIASAANVAQDFSLKSKIFFAVKRNRKNWREVIF